MASTKHYIDLLVDLIVQLFHRFIWSAPDINDIHDKAVFITGCDSGIGQLTALALNQDGLHVFAGCLLPDDDGAKALMTKARNPKNMTIIPIDVTIDTSVHQAYERVKHHLMNHSNKSIKLHAVINNAGIFPMFEVEWGSMHLIKQVINVNAIGPVLVTKTFLPLIRESKGRIINVNSIASRTALPYLVAYSMSKSALLAFTEGLRREMDKFGVRVISVEPSGYKIPRTKDSTLDSVRDGMLSIWTDADANVRQAYGDEYMKGILESLSSYQNITSENLSEITDVMRHAVINSCPRYQYLMASPVVRTIIFPLLTVCFNLMPQEMIEFLWRLVYLSFSSRNQTLTTTNASKIE